MNQIKKGETWTCVRTTICFTEDKDYVSPKNDFLTDDFGDEREACITHFKLKQMEKQLAIRVENEREFAALMKHYDTKGWASSGNRPAKNIDYNIDIDNCITHHDGFQFRMEDNAREDGYEILSFSAFSQLTGVEAVKEVRVPLSVNSYCTITERGIDFPDGLDFLSHHALDAIYAELKEFRK